MSKLAILIPSRNEKYLTVEHLSLDELSRIFSKIAVNRETGCWEWLAEKVRGYGRWRYRGRKELIHRVLYAWTTQTKLLRGHGKGKPELDHFTCSNAGCCNPAHLKLSTHADNTKRSLTSPTAVNARKVFCIRGHLLPLKGNRACDGGRYCKQCASDYGRQRYKAGREAYT